MSYPIRGMLIVAFLSGTASAVEGPAAQTELVAKSSLSWDGSLLPRYPQGTPEVTIARYIFPPGAELPLHKHPVINAGVLLRGELTISTDDKTLHLRAGDSIIELVDTWHHGKNEGAETAEILMFYAGVADTPITVK